LVGRSWYVREAAIKDHRFGLENASPEQVKPKEIDTTHTEWESPTYEADIPTTLPLVREKQLETTITKADEPHHDRILQMQEAWQAWFSQNRTVEQAPEPVVEEWQTQQNDFEEVDVPLVINRFDEPQVVEEAPSIIEERIERHLEPQNPLYAHFVHLYLGLRVAMVVIVLSAVAIATLGTGLVEMNVKGSTASVIQFITGTIIYSK
jgi:hypothetical protein